MNIMFANLWQTAALSVEGALNLNRNMQRSIYLGAEERTFCLSGILHTHLHSVSTVIKQLHCQMNSEVQRQCQKSDCGYSWLMVS